MGLTGDDVASWQTFLKGTDASSQIVVTSSFDAATLLATKQFQRSFGLTQDGSVGPATLSCAFKLGYCPLQDSRDPGDRLSGNWPAKPTDAVALSTSDVESLFGTFSYVPSPTASNPEAITLTGDWVSTNIATVSIPQLAPCNGGHTSIQCHKLISDQFVKTFDDWEKAKLSSRILSWGGSWVTRYMRGSRTKLSNHAWGTAFDINVAWNMLGARPAMADHIGSVRDLVGIAYDNGLFWGGWFQGRQDGMHFEARVIK